MSRKLTRQQSVVADFLAGVGGFRSAQDIHLGLRQAGSTVGLATVYRAVQVLADQGLVDVIRLEDGEARYRSCSPGHHHHLVCRTCGRAVELHAAAIERWADGVGEAEGFTHITHKVEVFGVCADCA